MTSDSDALVQELERVIEDNLTNSQFSVETLALMIGVSRSHLHRKLHKINNQSVSQFIREYRLKKAMWLLQTTNLKASEIAFKVGFGSVTYFSKSFTEFYGRPPSETKKRIQNGNRKSISNPMLKKLIGSAIVLICITVAFVIYILRSRVVQPTTDKVLAVMPFENMSDDDIQYFTNGVVDAISRQLLVVEDLRVIPRTTTTKLLGDGKTTINTAKELNATHLLEGTFQRNGNTFRIEARMIDPYTGTQNWAQYYDCKFKDIFRTQNEIAHYVASSLQSELSLSPISDFSNHYTSNEAAYELYLKGYYEYHTYTKEGTHNSIKYLKKAIELDPEFALAHTYLSYAIVSRAAIFCADLDAIEALDSGKIYIDKALTIAPDLPDAHSANGFYQLYRNWNFEMASEEYKKAIVDNNSDALAIYADYLHFIGEHEKGLEIAERLEKNEPFYPNSRMVLSYYYTGQYHKANEFVSSRMKVLNNYYMYDTFGFLLLNTGEYEKAVNVFHRALEIEGVRYPRILGWMGAAYAKSGKKDEALSIINELKERRLQNSAGSKGFFIAVVYAALENEVEALEWINVSVTDHEMEVPWLMSEPQFYSLHGHPEFRKIVGQIGFPQLGN